MNILLDLFLVFGKIGLFTFGGGYAMVSLIANACVDEKKWITNDDMLNITVIAESTPGPIAINCATFVGYRQAGLIGAISATAGIITPSFVIIYIISMFLDNFLKITIVANAFKGIKLAVGIIVIDAAIKMIKKMPKSKRSTAIITLSTIAMLAIDLLSLGFSSVSLIIVVAAITMIWFAVDGKKKYAPAVDAVESKVSDDKTEKEEQK